MAPMMKSTGSGRSDGSAEPVALCQAFPPRAKRCSKNRGRSRVKAPRQRGPRLEVELCFKSPRTPHVRPRAHPALRARIGPPGVASASSLRGMPGHERFREALLVRRRFTRCAFARSGHESDRRRVEGEGRPDMLASFDCNAVRGSSGKPLPADRSHRVPRRSRRGTRQAATDSK